MDSNCDTAFRRFGHREGAGNRRGPIDCKPAGTGIFPIGTNAIEGPSRICSHYSRLTLERDLAWPLMPLCCD